MTNRMSKRPVIADASGGVQRLERVSLSNGTFQESWIQELLEKEPSILPTADIDPIFSPLVCVAREVHLGVDEGKGGRIDNLYISPKGYLIIVETKLWRNPEARREVVGQILDYAKEVRTWDYEKLDAVYKSYHHNENGGLFHALVSSGYKTTDEEAAFVDIVQKNIKAARFLLMIVGDGIREGVEKMADYINGSPDMQHRLALCELEVYALAGGAHLVVPQLTLKTNIIERGVIRVENGEIKVDTGESEEEESAMCSHGNYAEWTANHPLLSREEFITAFIRSHQNISEDVISTFLDDVTDLGFQVGYTTKSASISLYLPQMRANIGMFVFAANSKDMGMSMWFVPARIFKRLKTLGYSEEIAKELLDSLRPFLVDAPSAYDDYTKFHYLSDDVLSDDRAEFLVALERFKNNF